MRTLLIFPIFLFVSFAPLKAQKTKYLHNCKTIDMFYLDNDSARIWTTVKYPNLSILTYARTEYEFENTPDTSKRDYILSGDSKFIIDSLCYMNDYNSDYTIPFDVIYIYEINKSKQDYLIISGGNGFFIGTNSQPTFLIFKKDKSTKNYHFISSYYIEDMETYDSGIYDSVKVITNNNHIILKGKNLKCLRGCW